jgi:hypothetical protein
VGEGLSRPEITANLARGVLRLLADHGHAALLEAPLANGRRADVMALDAHGRITIIETKSGLADFAADEKWPFYKDYCDAFYFAVEVDFPRHVIDPTCGLIVADAFGGAFLREAPVHLLSPARRKAVTLAFARLAAARLYRP